MQFGQLPQPTTRPHSSITILGQVPTLRQSRSRKPLHRKRGSQQAQRKNPPETPLPQNLNALRPLLGWLLVILITKHSVSSLHPFFFFSSFFFLSEEIKICGPSRGSGESFQKLVLTALPGHVAVSCSFLHLRPYIPGYQTQPSGIFFIPIRNPRGQKTNGFMTILPPKPWIAWSLT